MMQAAANVLPFRPLQAGRISRAPFAPDRFTVDGDPVLERRLAHTCAQVRSGIARIIPRRKLEGILLGGGYGRGEGGVRAAPGGHAAYNDLEFYVMVRGNPRINERLHGRALDDLAHRLSALAGAEVEFKILSFARLRRDPITMFSYDLVAGHRWLLGDDALLAGCGHHLAAEAIPQEEAARLLMNRCSGLLFAHERLDHAVDEQAADFVNRNLAKLRLALGDALLAASGRYHWSCRERHRRLVSIAADSPACGGQPGSAPFLGESGWRSICAEHEAGVSFKLHPTAPPAPAELFREFRSLAQMSCRVWLALEAVRLGRDFRSPLAYFDDPYPKLPGRSAFGHLALHLRTFGLSGAPWDGAMLRYPRERLLRALPVLLWEAAALERSVIRESVRRCLGARGASRPELIAAYTRLWERYR